jgi:polysaccharide chain length determinant protein (PEP-CTERM system associated)
MVDSASIPRRSYDFEDYVDILRRNIAWLIAPAFAGLVIATVIAFVFNRKDTWISAASIRVTPQQISEQMFKPITTQDVADRINGMAQLILSRNSLEGMITQFGLYPKLVKEEPMQDVVDQMRRDIGMHVSDGVMVNGRSLPQLNIWYGYTDKYTAQKICQELVSRFMNASNTDITEAQKSATLFVTDEYNQAKQQLDTAEKKLEDFRKANAGRLPEDVKMAVDQMNGLQAQLGQINQALNRNNEQKMMLDTQISAAKEHLAAVKSPAVVMHNQKVDDLNRQIEALDTNITEMKGHYTDAYPGLQAAKDKLEFLKKQRDAAMKEKVADDSKAAYDPATATMERINAQDTLNSLNTQMKALNVEAAQYRRDMANVTRALSQYQARLQNVVGEKEYEDLMRDRDVAKNHYFELENKRQLAVASTHIENQKQGQTLEQIDPPSLPTSPAAPKRATMLPMGVVAGLALGIVIVAIREVKDTSLKTLKDARMYTQLPVLGSVPLLENDVVVQRRKQMMWVSWATATVAGLAIMAISIGRYYLHNRG